MEEESVLMPTSGVYEGTYGKMSDLQDNINTVDKIANVVQNSQKCGGITSSCMSVIVIATESFSKRWDVSYPKCAVENFTESYRRPSETQWALESLYALGKAMLRKLLAFINNILNAAKGFILKFTNTGKEFKRRAKNIRGRLYKIQDSDTAARAILGTNVDKWAEDLVIDGKFDLDGYLAVVKQGLDTLPTVAERMEAVDKTIIDATKDFSELSPGENFSTLGKFAANVFEAFGVIRNYKANSTIPAGAKIINAFAYPGNKALVYYQYNEPETNGSYSTNIPISATVPLGIPKEFTIYALSAKEIAKVCGVLETVAGDFDRYVQEFNSRNKRLIQLRDNVNRADDESYNDDNEATRLALKIAQQQLLNQQVMDRFSREFYLTTCRGLEALCEKSLAVY